MKKITLAIIAIFIGSVLFVAPSFAAEKDASCTCADGKPGKVTVNTSILGGCDCSEAGGENAIENILHRVVNIMSVGIGILAVIGISVSGIQYLTAGGNEEKTRKAKRRIFEIIIGIAIYVLIFALLQWLLPEFSGLGSTGAGSQK